jgi:hypothetical protein
MTAEEIFVPRGGCPPLVPIWPGARVIERNPFPFFPLNPKWLTDMSRSDTETFCSLLKLAWTSQRPGYLPPDGQELANLLREACRPCQVPDLVLQRFHRQKSTGLLFFPPQMRALRRLVAGEDMYSLLWDESL